LVQCLEKGPCIRCGFAAFDLHEHPACGPVHRA
jgi:hypothetical protein